MEPEPNKTLDKNVSVLTPGRTTPITRMGTNEESSDNHWKHLFKFSTITNVVHLFNVCFVLLIVYLSLSKEFEFFTWHPLLLSIGWMLLMTEGILTLNKENTFLKNVIGSNRVLFHWILQAIALLSITAGFIVAFKNKSDKNKAHFKSWHALFGLLGVIFAVPSGFNGVITLYSRELKNFYSQKLNRFVHILVGTLAYLFGGISAILSVYTRWFERRTSSSTVIFVVALVLVTCVVIWTLIKPVNTVSKRFRNLISM